MYHEASITPNTAILSWYLAKKFGWQASQRTAKDELIGCCPFQEERTPSFWLYPAPNARIHCYGCGIHADFLRLLAIMELGIGPNAPTLPAKVFALRDEWLAIFIEEGGDPSQVQREQRQIIRQPYPILNVPGPLQRQVLTRIMEWSHQQLHGSSQAARNAYDYQQRRGATPTLLKECLALGYMPESQDLSDTQFFALQAVCTVTPAQLQIERDWYQAQDPTLPKEYLSFLVSPEAFQQRMGIFNRKGRLRLGHRVLFFSRDPFEKEALFYQGRLATNCIPKRIPKFLNTPELQKVPFQLLVPHAVRQVTLITESPYGPVVNASLRLCARGIGKLGQGRPDESFWQEIPGPFLCADDNDPRFDKQGKLVYAGEKQARQYLEFFHTQGKRAYRLLPPLREKGFDEWGQQQGAGPLLADIDLILALGGQK